MNKKPVVIGISILVLAGGAGYWYISNNAPLAHTETIPPPSDCHGDANGIAYWRADKVNLAYFEKDHKVYYCDVRQGGGPILVSEEPASFTLISGGLPKDDPLHDVVPVYAKDGKQVYADYIVLNKAKPDTFKLLDPIGIGVDGEHIYSGSHMLDSAEWYPRTLTLKWPSYYYSIDDSVSPKRLKVFAEINGNHVALDTYSGQIYSMPGITFDVASFEVLFGALPPYLYAKDKHHVYCWSKTSIPTVLEGADPQTFHAATRAEINETSQKGIEIDGTDTGHFYNKCSIAAAH